MLLGLRFDWLAHCQCTGQFLCERDHGFPGDRGGRSGGYGLGAAVFCLHGWEIAVKSNFQNQNFFFFFSFFFFFTLFQHVYNVQLDDFRFATYANIAVRHFTALPPAKPPSSFAHA